jgi:hypothetical protein
MILIDGTYFVGELALPNIPVSGGEDLSGTALALQTVGENNLDVFIDKYVIDYLIRLLGRELAHKFLEEISKPSPDQIWLDIKNQLLITIGLYKMSPLANYVYFMVMRDAVTKTTQGGESDPDFDFAENASNRYKYVNAWNGMTDMTAPIVMWLCENADTYRSYAGRCVGKNVSSIVQKINKYDI